MSEFSEGQLPNTSPVEAVEQQIAYEDKQAALGKEWAAIYSDPNKPLVNSAEIVLRNPATYSRDIDKYNLPEELRIEWQKLSAFAESASNAVAIHPVDWGNIGGLDRVQSMIFRGEINPTFRGTVGDIIRASSDLFSRSVKVAPGNTEYQKGNVVAAEAWLNNYRQTQAVSTSQQI